VDRAADPTQSLSSALFVGLKSRHRALCSRPSGVGVVSDEWTRACGTELRSSTARAKPGSGRRAASVALACAASLAIALSSPGAVAGAQAKAPHRPQPTELWRAYPLEPAGAGSSVRPRVGKTVPLHRDIESAALRRASSRAAAAGPSTAAWVAGALGLLAVLFAAFAVSRQLTARVLRSPLGHGLLPEPLRAFGGRVSRRARSLTSFVERARAAAAIHRQNLFEPAFATARLDAVRRSAAPPKLSVPSARQPVEAERSDRTPAQAVLKHKQKEAVVQPKGVTKLKAKARVAAPRKDPTRHDLEILKAKLAERPSKLRDAALTRSPGKRPLMSVAPRANEQQWEVASTPSCRIEWWRGYVKSQFYAKLVTSDGCESIVRSSPLFGWSKPTTPPRDLPRVAHAHATLLSRLEADGWVKTNRGDDWYAFELKRRRPHAPRPEREGET
jgi:hypothetical protein